MATMAGQTLPQEATAQNRLLRSRSNRLAATVLRLWHKHAQPDFDLAFADMMPDLFRALDTAHYRIAKDAIESTPKIMESFGVLAAHPEYRPDPWQWVGVNGNGMNTVDTMWTAVTVGKKAVVNGAPVDVAMDRIGVTLVLRTRTMLADTHRSATSMTARGICYQSTYVRGLTPPSCGRCVILAGQPCGKTPFERHPRCDCIAVYTGLKAPANACTSPSEYLDSLDEGQLAKVLGGRANARAYTDGADLNQLVNAQRGIRTAQIDGRNIKYTTEGTTRHGLAASRMIDSGYAREFVKNGGRYTKIDRPRLMPETIYARCGDDHAKALSMLYKYGWIL